MSTLVICEKSDVAQRLAAVLGPFTRTNDTITCGDITLVWCQGHLLTLSEPEDYIPGYTPKWDTLPYVPSPFVYKPKSSWCEHQLALIGREYKLADDIVNACDSGREGELIFTSVYNYVSKGVIKPVYRMWFSATDPDSLKEAWDERKPSSSKHKALAESGKARQEADWIMGINGSQALNLCIYAGIALNLKEQPKTWSLGRVQTATLGLLYSQHKTINKFVAQPYYSVYVHFPRNPANPRKDLYPAKVLVPEGGAMFQDRKAHYENPREASMVISLIKRNKRENWSVQDEEAIKAIKPPLPFDLTQLQKCAGDNYAWPSKYTLELAQKCYEHGCLSYPRTDSPCLPSKTKAWADKLFTMALAYFASDSEAHLDTLTPPSACPNTKKIFNDKRVTDHHGLVPTALPDWDAKTKEETDAKLLWELVAKQFLTSCGLIAEHKVITRTATQSTVLPRDIFDKVPGDPIVMTAISTFQSIPKKGWLELALYWKLFTPFKELPADVSPVPDKEIAHVIQMREADAYKSMSKPPDYFSESDVLRLMEMNELGTPATRASTLETLFTREYIRRMKKQLGKVVLMVTARGLELGERLGKADLAFLLNASTTGKWESALKLVEQEKPTLIPIPQFMIEVEEKTKEIVTKLKSLADYQTKPTTLNCPKSGKPILENENEYMFPGFPGLKCPKQIAGAFMSKVAYIEILSRSSGSGPFRFTSKKGKRFKAMLVYKPDLNKIEFDFD